MDGAGEVVARGTALTLGAQAVRLVVQVAGLLVLARLLTPSDFGLVAMVVALTGVAAVLGDFGLSLAAMRSRSITQQQKSNLFWTNTAIGTVLAIVVASASGLIAELYGRPEVQGITLALSSVLILSAATSQYRAEAAGRLLFGRAAACDAIAPSVGLVGAAAAAACGAGYWSLVAQQLITAAVLLAALVVVTRWVPRLPAREKGMRAFYRTGSHTLLVQLLSYLTSNIDSAIIGRTFGAATLGFYDRAFQLFRLPLQQVAGPLTRVVLPVLARTRDGDDFERRLIRLHVLMAYSMGTGFALSIGLADPVVRLAFGPGWDPSAAFLKVLALGGFFQMITFVYYWGFLAQDQVLVQLRYTIWSRGAMIILMIGGAFLGPMYVAAAASAGLFINWATLTYFGLPIIGVRRRVLARHLCAPLAVVGIVTLVSALSELALDAHGPPVRLLGSLLAAFGTTATITLLLPPLRRSMLEALRVTMYLRPGRRGGL